METLALFAPAPVPSPAAPAPTPSDSVARRIVMPRRVWDQLVRMAEALEVTQGIAAQPADLAVIALEAGLSQIERRKAEEPAPAGAQARAARPRAARPLDAGASTTRKRRRGAAVRLSEGDQAELAALLARQRSVRARQRTIALWLGLRRRRVAVEALRQLATRHDAYCVANFAQNMKKDAAYFVEVRDADGRRDGWRLTSTGLARARTEAAGALALA